jgi:hypothetical protein
MVSDPGSAYATFGIGLTFSAYYFWISSRVWIKVMGTLRMQALLYGNNLDKNLPYAIELRACHKIGRDIPDMHDSTRHKVYDSLIWKEVGESCLFGLKVQNGSHKKVAKFINDNYGMR